MYENMIAANNHSCQRNTVVWNGPKWSLFVRVGVSYCAVTVQVFNSNVIDILVVHTVRFHEDFP